MKKAFRTILILIAILVGFFVLIQFLPIGKNHTNPIVVSEPAWDSSVTRDLAKRACFGCHSNETVWPWYSNIAPVSWLVTSDVIEGRGRMNFSDWGRGYQPSVGEIVGIIQEGEMPPVQYLLMHPEAKLSALDKQALSDGLLNSIP